MGRYYKTTDSSHLDFMAKLPEKFMLQALQTADAANDAIYAQTDLLGNALLSVNHLTSDQERVAQKQAEYNQRIDEIIKPLTEDHANYRKHMPVMRSLSRDLQSDMTTGELAAIQANASKLAEWDKNAKLKLNSGKITPDAYRIAKGAFLKQFDAQGGTKYDPSTKVGNTIYTEDLYETQDFAKLLKDKVGTIKSSAKSYKQDSDGGKWLVTNGGKEEWVNASRVAQIASDALTSDQNVMGYLRQGGKMGYLRGVYDESGEFIQPYQLDKQGNPVFNMNSILAAPIRGLVGQEAFRKSESERGLKVNDYTKQAIDFANDIQKIGINHANAQDLEEQRTANDIKLAELRGEIQKSVKGTPSGAKGTTSKTTASTQDVKPDEPELVKSADGSIAVNPLAGKDSQGNTKFDLDLSKKKLALVQSEAVKLQTQLKDPNLKLSGNQRAMMQQQLDNKLVLQQQQAEIVQRSESWIAQQMVKNGYAPVDVQKAQKSNEIIQRLDKKREEITAQQWAYLQNGQLDKSQALKTQLSTIDKAKQQVEKASKAYNKLANKWYDENAERNSFKVEGVGLEPTEKDLIYNQLASNPQGFKIYDTNTNELIDKDLEAAIFNGGDQRGNISITKINNPVPGVGTTVSFKFKDEGKETGKELLMTIPSAIQDSLATTLGTKDSPAHKRIADNLSTHNRVEFLSSIKNRVVDRLSDGTMQPTGYYNYYDDKSGYNSTIKVVPFDNPNPDLRGDAPQGFKVHVKMVDGSYKYFGEFANEQAIADMLFPAKAKK